MDYYHDTIPMLDALHELIVLGQAGCMTPWERNHVEKKHKVFHECFCKVRYEEYAKVKEIYKSAFKEGEDEEGA
jgi:hypothetical protein